MLTGNKRLIRQGRETYWLQDFGVIVALLSLELVVPIVSVLGLVTPWPACISSGAGHLVVGSSKRRKLEVRGKYNKEGV